MSMTPRETVAQSPASRSPLGLRLNEGLSDGDLGGAGFCVELLDEQHVVVERLPGKLHKVFVVGEEYHLRFF